MHHCQRQLLKVFRLTLSWYTRSPVPRGSAKHNSIRPFPQTRTLASPIFSNGPLYLLLFPPADTSMPIDALQWEARLVHDPRAALALSAPPRRNGEQREKNEFHGISPRGRLIRNQRFSPFSRRSCCATCPAIALRRPVARLAPRRTRWRHRLARPELEVVRTRRPRGGHLCL